MSGLLKAWKGIDACAWDSGRDRSGSKVGGARAFQKGPLRLKSSQRDRARQAARPRSRGARCCLAAPSGEVIRFTACFWIVLWAPYKLAWIF